MTITKEGLFKYQVLNERQRKNLLILDAIRRYGPISKAGLSRQLGYNIVTLSNYIGEYLDKRLVYEDGFDSSTGGRKPVLIELNKKEVFFIGIDFGREGIRGILTDFVLNIIAEAKAPRPEIEQEDVSRSLIAVVRELLKKSAVDVAKVRFIAIGVYGYLEEKNGAIKGLDEEKGHLRATVYFTELKQSLEKEFNIRTLFGTDALCAAFGERVKNAAAEVDSMVYIFQDIGKGVVIKGEIYCGTNLGTVDIEGVTGSLSAEERTRLTENFSYLRPWDSKTSLKKEAMKVIERGVGTRIVELLNGNRESLNDDVIIKAAKEGDDVAVELIEGIGINLGVRIAYLINLFAPRVVIVGGGIEKAGDLLFTQVNKTIEKLALDKLRQDIKIVPGVCGENAVTAGAASVALREVFLEA